MNLSLCGILGAKSTCLGKWYGGWGGGSSSSSSSSLLVWDSHDFGDLLKILHEEFCNEIWEGCSFYFCNSKNLSLTQFGVSMWKLYLKKWKRGNCHRKGGQKFQGLITIWWRGSCFWNLEWLCIKLLAFQRAITLLVWN